MIVKGRHIGVVEFDYASAEPGFHALTPAEHYITAVRASDPNDATGSSGRVIPVSRNYYDDAGRLIRTCDGSDPTPHCVAIAYDPGAMTQVVTDRLGRPTVYEYDARGSVTAETNALGETVRRTYDADGNELTVTDPLGRTTAMSYDAKGNVTKVADPLGNATALSYDPSGTRISKVTGALGLSSSCTAYDAKKNCLGTVDPLGRKRSQSYDASGNVLSVKDEAGGTTSYTRNPNGHVTRRTNALGELLETDVDGRGIVMESRQSFTDIDGNARVERTSKTVNDLGYLDVKTRHGDGVTLTENYDYNANRQITRITNAQGRAVENHYNSRFELDQVTFPDGSSVSYEYDFNGNKIKETDAKNRVTRYEYDLVGRLLKTIAPDGSFVRTVYDAAGEAVQTVDELGQSVRAVYDSGGRPVASVDPLGNVTRSEYDAERRLAALVDPAGRRWAGEHDALGRMSRAIAPDGSSRVAHYNDLGQLNQAVDENGNATQYEYDALGRLAAVVDAIGGRTTYTYDAAGNRTVIRDAEGSETRFLYDSLGRMREKRVPGGGVYRYAYDELGNRVREENPDGEIMVSEYDYVCASGSPRMTAQRWTSGPYAGKVVLYGYSKACELETVTDDRGITVYTHDLHGRLTAVESPGGGRVEYAYDAAGKRQTVTARIGARVMTWNYTYDALGRMASMARDGKVTGYAYDSVGNLIAITFPNGVVTKYEYNVKRQLTLVETRDATGTVIDRHAYTLDAAGRRIRIDGLGGKGYNYAYDPAGRLVREERFGAGAGNGAVNPFETCDGDEPCANGCYYGTRTCSSDCLTLSETCDTNSQQCGNGLIEGCEICDSNIQPCTEGCYAGAQACLGDCSGYEADCIVNGQACGNGVVEGCEVCDDGNVDECSGDCNADCTGLVSAPVCGNEVRECGEICDDGVSNGQPGKCRIDCLGAVTPRCGDGIADFPEACDGESRSCHVDCYEGIQVCYADCSAYSLCDHGPQSCGNGKTEGCETCDDGYESPGCDSDCTFPECGDLMVNPATGEACDDGPGGDCYDDCTGLNICGDGIILGSEICDSFGLDTDLCDSDCTHPICGDQHFNTAAGEVCDGGTANTPNCDRDCTLPVCGDGISNSPTGEACDSGGVDTAQCDSDCTLPACSDGHANLATGEECDSGGIDTADCDSDCTLPTCGDGHFNSAAGEYCDSSGIISPTCDFDCTQPQCGDNLLNAQAGEGCDDGNLNSGDGCSSVCLSEVGCAANPSIIGQYNTTGSLINISVHNGMAFIADQWGGLAIVNVAVSSNPVLISVVTSVGSIMNVKSQNQVLGLIGWPNRFILVDISNVNSPVEKYSRYMGPSAFEDESIALSGNYAYTINTNARTYLSCDRKVWKFDISNPDSVFLNSTFSTGFVQEPCKHSKDAFVDGGYLYEIGGFGKISNYEMSYLYPNNIYGTGISDDAVGAVKVGNTVYLANNNPRLEILDWSDSTPALLLGQLPGLPSQAAKGIAYSNGYIYLAEGNTGIEQIDVSDPYNPTPVTTINTPGFANNLVVVNGYAYVADGSAGLVIIGGLPGCHTCGNTVVENGETCDDGNLTPGDGCNATCTGP